MGFTFGGMSLPAPSLSLGPFNGIPEFSISIWAPFVWVLVTLLLLLAARRILTVNHWQRWLQNQSHRPILILIIWTLLHNLLFMVYMPIPGTASRYGAVNHIFIWVAIVFGLRELATRQRLQLGLAMFLGAFSMINMLYWDSVYAANIEHMEEVRIESAHFLRDTLPENEICAAYDIGALRYHSELPILAGALIDPQAAEYFINGQLDQYLLDNQAHCLVIPGRSGSADEGWFDLIEIFDLNNKKLIILETVAEFEIPYDRWLLGYLPTNNYQASVNIYNVRVNEDSTYFQSQASKGSPDSQP